MTVQSQGPKQNTVLDFWRMALEHRARHIVMLTNNQEQVEQGSDVMSDYWFSNNNNNNHLGPGQMCPILASPRANASFWRSLSSHYWRGGNPSWPYKANHWGNEWKNFGDISDIPTLIILKVTVENEDGDEEELVHKVTHLHLTSWPDHGVSWKYKVQGSRCIKYKVDYKFIICPASHTISIVNDMLTAMSARFPTTYQVFLLSSEWPMLIRMTTTPLFIVALASEGLVSIPYSGSSTNMKYVWKLAKHHPAQTLTDICCVSIVVAPCLIVVTLTQAHSWLCNTWQSLSSLESPPLIYFLR